MSKRSLCVAFSVFAGTVAACGSGSSSNSGSGISFEQLPAKYAAAACTAYAHCLGPIFDLYFNGVDCTELTTQRLNNGTFALVQQKIEQGTVTYDATKAQACLDAVAALTCDDLLLRDHPECIAALDGTVALAGDCDIDEECKGSAICKSSSGTCPGTCSALLTAGQTCSEDGDCDNGLQCSSETRLCVKPATLGGTCDYGSPPCGPGLICLGKNDDAMTPGKCYNATAALSASVDAACDPTLGTLCKSGLSCIADSYDATAAQVVWKCVQAGTYAAGQACKPGFPDACTAGNYCQTGTGALALTGICAAIPDAKQPCGAGFGAQCQTGAVCVAGLCQNYAANGVSCTGDEMCYSQYCGTSSGCEPRLPCK